MAEPSSRHDVEVATVAEVQQHFRDFMESYPELWLYGRICAGAAQDDGVAGLLLDARPGQARPVLFLAAVHDLVLADPSVPAARWYPSVAPDAPRAGDPWPDVRRTVLEHGDALRQTIAARTTQTNEVNRAAYLAPALARAAADDPGRPVALVELGASAGLLLALDRYRVDLVHPSRTTTLGDPGATVRCSAEDRSPSPFDGTLPTVTARHGLDLHPVHVHDVEAVRWLEACLWPDVPERLERFRAAVSLARTAPPTLHTGSMTQDLAPLLRAVHEQHPGSHLVVVCSWALTYVAREQRELVATACAEVAADGAPVTWLTAEPPGAVPGLPEPPVQEATTEVTTLAARRWREGHEATGLRIGTCHAHARWIDLHPQVTHP